MNANITAQKGLRTFILMILLGVGVFLTVSAAQYGYQVWTRAREPSEPIVPTEEVVGNLFEPLAGAKIFGHKFNDLNGNGVWDLPSEPGIGGATITLKDELGNILSSTETSEETDLGYYLFENLEPENYIVEETAASFEVTLRAGEEKQINFGNRTL